MGQATSVRQRKRGSIDALPSGALRVRVYAGADPLSGKAHYLTEVVLAGPKAAAQAEKVRTRLLWPQLNKIVLSGKCVVMITK